MGATTVMGIIMIIWCVATLAAHPEKLQLPAARPPTSTARSTRSRSEPMLDPLGKQVDPLGFLGHTPAGRVAPVGAHARATGSACWAWSAS